MPECGKQRSIQYIYTCSGLSPVITETEDGDRVDGTPFTDRRMKSSFWRRAPRHPPIQPATPDA